MDEAVARFSLFLNPATKSSMSETIDLKNLRPLSGIRVVELAMWVAGPSCSAVLGDWGADVIKLEDPNGGDPIRGAVTTRAMTDARAVPPYELDNRNKRSVAVDLRRAEGVELCDEDHRARRRLHHQPSGRDAGANETRLRLDEGRQSAPRVCLAQWLRASWARPESSRFRLRGGMGALRHHAYRRRAGSGAAGAATRHDRSCCGPRPRGCDLSRITATHADRTWMRGEHFAVPDGPVDERGRPDYRSHHGEGARAGKLAANAPIRCGIPINARTAGGSIS